MKNNTTAMQTAFKVLPVLTFLLISTFFQTVLHAATDITPPVISDIQLTKLKPASVVIQWKTNEESNSQVEYGTTSSYGNTSTTFDNSWGSGATDHFVALISLTPNTTYYYRVKSKDYADNWTISSQQVFTTPLIDPKKIVLISNVSPQGSIAVNATQTTLSVSTNIDATCAYSRTAGGLFYEAEQAFSSTGGRSHSTTLAGLRSGKSYHYFVRCTDTAGHISEDMPVYFYTGPWTAPIGIPDPKDSFGFAVDTPTPNWPVSWTANPPSVTPNYYYVDKTNPAATDSNNLYGHPGLPRKTFPNRWNGPWYSAGGLPAGSFIYIHAGNYTIEDINVYDITNAKGTRENPIWFTGNPQNHPQVQTTVQIGSSDNTSYIIWENIDLTPSGVVLGLERYGGFDIRPGAIRIVSKEQFVAADSAGGAQVYDTLLARGILEEAHSVAYVEYVNNLLIYKPAVRLKRGDNDPNTIDLPSNVNMLPIARPAEMQGSNYNYIWAVLSQLPISVDHILIRNSTISGKVDYFSGGGVGIGASQIDEFPFNVQDVVVFNCYIHTIGNPPQANSEHGGVYKAYHTNNVWVLDNVMHDIGADAVAGAHGAGDTEQMSKNYFIGRNVLYEGGENGIDLKSTGRVVISENEIWGPFAREQGWGIVIHSGSTPVPVSDAWIIFNRIHHVSSGILGTSTNGTYNVGVVGNLLYDIKDEWSIVRGEPWNGWAVGLLATTGQGNYVVDNTISRTDKGFLISGSNDFRLKFHGNIIHSRNDLSKHDIFVESPQDSLLDFDYNIWPSSLNIRWGNVGSFNSLSAFKAATQEEEHGLSGDPLFTNASNGNFTLQPTSPARNSSVEGPVGSSAYDAFFNLFGESIKKDKDGNIRPQGSVWDRGANQYQGDGTTPNNIAPTVSAGMPKTGILVNSVILDGTVNDPDGPSLTTTWSKVSGPGSVSFANANSVDTTATFSALGSYVLRLTAFDGINSASSNVTITINPLMTFNSANLAQSKLTATLPTDLVGRVARVTFMNGVDVIANDDIAPYEATLNLSGLSVPATYAFVVNVFGSNGAVLASEPLTVTVSPGAALPVITTQPQSREVGLNGVFEFSVGVSGTGPFTYQWKRNGYNLERGTGSSYQGYANADTIGDYQVLVSNSAGSVLSVVARLTFLPVVVTNTAPVANPQSVSTAEDIAKSIDLSGTDEEKDILSCVIVTQPTHGTVSLSGCAANYTPTANYNGADSFTFKVNDRRLDSLPATVSIAITPVNDAPILPVIPDQSIAEDYLLAIPIGVVDIDSAFRVTAKSSSNQNLVINGKIFFTRVGNEWTMRVRTEFNKSGETMISFTVTDEQGLSTTRSFRLTVNSVNDRPVAYQQLRLAVPKNGTKSIALFARDAEGSALEYKIVSQPLHGTLSGRAPNVTYTPAKDYSGTDYFSFKVNDGELDSNTANIYLIVDNNSKPW